MRKYIDIILEATSPVMTDESLIQPDGLRDFKQFVRKPSTLPNDIFSKAYVELQRDHGWELAGKGSFGYVYEHPSHPDQVLKIFQDPAYEKWILFCKAHKNNPYLPRFIGGIVSIKDDIKAVRVEKLAKILTEEQLTLYDKFIAIVREFMANGTAPQDKNLAIALKWLKDHELSGGHIDFHLGNFMLRGSHLVITDPIS